MSSVTSHFLVVTLLILASCASKEVHLKSNEYGKAHEVVKTQYGEFLVFEHPSSQSLAVSSTMSGAVAQGVVKGLTFGAGNILPSEGAYQEAAEVYLKKHKQIAHCKIANGYILQEPIYEFKLTC